MCYNTEKTTETLKRISDILGDIPLLFTIRTKEEGGSISLSVQQNDHWQKIISGYTKNEAGKQGAKNCSKKGSTAASPASEHHSH